MRKSWTDREGRLWGARWGDPGGRENTKEWTNGGGRMTSGLGDSGGKYKRVAEPREAGWCQWEERERAPVAMTAPTGGGTGGCRWKAMASRADGTRI